MEIKQRFLKVNSQNEVEVSQKRQFKIMKTPEKSVNNSQTVKNKKNNSQQFVLNLKIPKFIEDKRRSGSLTNSPAGNRNKRISKDGIRDSSHIVSPLYAPTNSKRSRSKPQEIKPEKNLVARENLSELSLNPSETEHIIKNNEKIYEESKKPAKNTIEKNSRESNLLICFNNKKGKAQGKRKINIYRSKAIEDHAKRRPSPDKQKETQKKAHKPVRISKETKFIENKKEKKAKPSTNPSQNPKNFIKTKKNKLSLEKNSKKPEDLKHKAASSKDRKNLKSTTSFKPGKINLKIFLSHDNRISISKSFENSEPNSSNEKYSEFNPFSLKKFKENKAAIKIQRWYRSLNHLKTYNNTLHLNSKKKGSNDSVSIEISDSSSDIQAKKEEWVSFFNSKFTGKNSEFVEEFKQNLQNRTLSYNTRRRSLEIDRAEKDLSLYYPKSKENSLKIDLSEPKKSVPTLDLTKISKNKKPKGKKLELKSSKSNCNMFFRNRSDQLLDEAGIKKNGKKKLRNKIWSYTQRVEKKCLELKKLKRHEKNDKDSKEFNEIEVLFDDIVNEYSDNEEVEKKNIEELKKDKIRKFSELSEGLIENSQIKLKEVSNKCEEKPELEPEIVLESFLTFQEINNSEPERTEVLKNYDFSQFSNLDLKFPSVSPQKSDVKTPLNPENSPLASKHRDCSSEDPEKTPSPVHYSKKIEEINLILSKYSEKKIENSKKPENCENKTKNIEKCLENANQEILRIRQKMEKHAISKKNSQEFPITINESSEKKYSSPRVKTSKNYSIEDKNSKINTKPTKKINEKIPKALDSKPETKPDKSFSLGKILGNSGNLDELPSFSDINPDSPKNKSPKPVKYTIKIIEPPEDSQDEKEFNIKTNENFEQLLCVDRPADINPNTVKNDTSNLPLTPSPLIATDKKPSPLLLGFHIEDLAKDIISSELDQFIQIIRTNTTSKSIDPSFSYLASYLDTLEDQLKSYETDFLNVVNTPSYTQPLEKLEILSSSASIARPANLELMLPENLCDNLKAILNSLEIPSLQIYQHMIFDCTNEAFNYLRPFGVKGVPDPWSPCTTIIFGESKLACAFEKVKDLFSSWNSCKIGQLHNNPLENLQEARTLNLNNLLSKDMKTENSSWTEWTDEEVQLKLELSDKILDYLICEFIEKLSEKI